MFIGFVKDLKDEPNFTLIEMFSPPKHCQNVYLFLSFEVCITAVKKNAHVS